MRAGVFLGVGWVGCGTPTAPPPPPTPSEAAPPEATDWQGAFARREPKSVVDYVMLLSDLWNCDAGLERSHDEAARRASFQVVDVKNGFVSFRAPGDTWDTQVALFRTPAAGRDVIGVATNCGMGCMCNRQMFLSWDEGQWRDLDVLPVREIEARLGPETPWWIDLPRVGTTVSVVDERGAKRLALEWKGGAFAVRDP